MELVDLAGSLPYLPALEVFKTFSTSELILLSVQSEKWRTVVGGVLQYRRQPSKVEFFIDGYRENCTVVAGIRVLCGADESDVFINFLRKSEGFETVFCAFSDFDITTKPDLLSYEEYLRKKEKGENSKPEEVIIDVDCEDFHQIQKDFLKFSASLLSIFSPISRVVYAHFDTPFTDLTLQFLKSLRGIRIAKLHLTSENDGLDIVQLNEIINVLSVTEEFLVEGNGAGELDSAMSLSGTSICSLNCQQGKFGGDSLTSQDLNGFLYNWKMGLNQNVERLEFCISEYKSFNYKEILFGLSAQPWVSGRRDKKYIIDARRDDVEVFDLSNGWDITRKNGTIGTIHLSPDAINFFVWNTPLQLVKVKMEYVGRLEVVRKRLDELWQKYPSLFRWAEEYCAEKGFKKSTRPMDPSNIFWELRSLVDNVYAQRQLLKSLELLD